MSKKCDLLVSDDDEQEEIKLNVDNEYAKRYDTWRKKEELQKLKDRYGDAVDDESSSESESEDATEEWTSTHEKHFLLTLAALKSGDSSILDGNKRFFPTVTPKVESEPNKEKKSKTTEPMYLRDYERKLITEREGELSDDDDLAGATTSEEATRAQIEASVPGSFVDQQRKIIQSFHEVLKDDEDGKSDKSEDDGGLLKKRVKTVEEQKREDDDYLEWLKGHEEQLQNADDNEMKQLLLYFHAPLRSYWTNPSLPEGERFLRDYILERRYDTHDNNDIPTYDEIIEDDEELAEDEAQLERQELFEHKYNFRFEEPDQEFIKAYPRTIKDSVRRIDDKRKEQRESHKERKEKEKQKRKADIKRLKALKRQEIEEKINRLRAISGDESMKFDVDDLEKDFDPAEYDEKMKTLFDEQYYANEDAEKPVFSDLSDSDNESVDYDHWEDQHLKTGSPKKLVKVEKSRENDAQADEPGPCSSAARGGFLPDTLHKKRRKRKSRLAELLSAEKPNFDPKEKSFQEYYDEYYKLDCEDFIGDMPCRFKYRQVPKNDYGLSAEEVILADDKELNAWASLRKMTQYRPQHEEEHERAVFSRKAMNTQKKMRILPSVFASVKEEQHEAEQADESTTISKKKNRRRRKKKVANMGDGDAGDGVNQDNTGIKSELNSEGEEKTEEKPDSSGKGASVDNEIAAETQMTGTATAGPRKKKKKKRKHVQDDSQRTGDLAGKRKKRNDAVVAQSRTLVDTLSDDRLKAFGLNPKKFRNKMKYTSKKTNYV